MASFGKFGQAEQYRHMRMSASNQYEMFRHASAFT
jgi:hypothetical protein